MNKGFGKGAGFWAEWETPDDEQGPRRGRRRWARSERGEHWRQHFNNYMGEYPEDHWLFGGRRFRPWHRGRAGFNPFVANLMSMGGGLLPVLVLQMIAEEPRYGNEITKLIRQRTGGQWMANPGAMYPLLTQLEEEGFITGEWEDPRKRTMRVYSITPQGKLELARLIEIVRPKISEMITVLTGIEEGMSATTGQDNGDE